MITSLLQLRRLKLGSVNLYFDALILLLGLLRLIQTAPEYLRQLPQEEVKKQEDLRQPIRQDCFPNGSQNDTQNIPYLEEMKQNNMSLSMRQQRKVFTVMDKLFRWIQDTAEVKYLWRPDTARRTDRYHAYLLNDEYAFRHIFKNGGTTVENLLHERQVKPGQLGDRQLMTVVRDPIDHFLSGWGECGVRYASIMVPQPTENRTYDERVKEWLHWIQKPKRFCPGTQEHTLACVKCATHSFPQALYLAATDRSHLDLVGDLEELPSMLGLVGFPYQEKTEIANSAGKSQVKQDYFPKRRDLLSNSTLKALCRYLAFDYYLLDYAPPETCQDVLPYLEKWSFNTTNSKKESCQG